MSDRPSWLELILIVAMAVFIGGAIGIQVGWDQSCVYATKLYDGHKSGEIIVPAPVRELNGVVFGTGWMKTKLCEAR